MQKGYQILWLLLFLGFCSVLAKHWPTDSSEWAGWVQAIGSIGAILTAVWVSHRDNQNAAQRALESEKQEGKRAAAALATELAVHWKHYQEVAGGAIECHTKGTAFLSYWFPPEHPFPIYRGYSGRLHLIDSTELQEALIFAYSSFQTLFTAYRSNNKSMDELDEINRLTTQQFSQASELGNVIIARMSRYSPSINNAHERTKHAVSQVQSLLASFMTPEAPPSSGHSQ
ncbi:hypothetical protein AKG08_20405 [Achromobacter piechaudii]|uniref:hypothetical protein n=1 Tax=Achromobacter piechaudii TaxID=72556 RepID=UPI0006828758|nr:hypothetical protein [Achromobacter piechaudii]KNY09175.1 hypothetical protein AKG08_20405 [Achromobacter piechaudii]